MPTLTIEGEGSFEVEKGTRLVNAIREAGVDIGHRCGGHAQCTTCRVTFSAGEPDTMTPAEHEKLHQIKQFGEMRLSCQIRVDGPMHVTPLMRLEDQSWDDTGPEPADAIEPEDNPVSIDSLESDA
ncbi:MAG: 2Fe-2S iron-sulfur cluster-binding protein [Longimonas sp.]|uniref:2Fe-2S iron-sulfur cluster-binding protein n=1 Tax=Longimonas sp. TaxID=2039626 RepID=UPI003349AA2B